MVDEVELTPELQRAGVGYATHLEALGWALGQTTGAVLEAGAGWYSTAMLHGYCMAADRLLVTVEPDEEWRARFRPYATYMHRIEEGPIRDVMREVRPQVVLVDGPPGPDRAAVLRAAWEWAAPEALVVVHDTDPDRMGDPETSMFPGLADALEGWPNRRVFATIQPWTTVVWR